MQTMIVKTQNMKNYDMMKIVKQIEIFEEKNSWRPKRFPK